VLAGMVLVLVAVGLLGVGASPARAVTADDAAQAPVEITYFWGDGCPNCAQARIFLDTVEADYPNVTITDHEVWNSETNRDLFKQTADEVGFTASSVPTIIIDERVWIGWTDQVEQDVSRAIDLAAQGTSPQPGVYGSPDAGTCADDATECTSADGTLLDVPFAGEVNLGERSLLVSTLLIGFVDGINPCSLWVITILLVIVVRTGSRRRVFAIGSTFLVVTAAMYALYMAAMYSALTVVGYLGVIQIVVALAALIFGVVSVKDYFALKKGLSFTISDTAKPGIFQRARHAAGQKALLPALVATVGLAVAVSLLEAPCTAGFPLLWTGMLQANEVGAAETGLLWIAYMVPYLLDEMAIFAVAIITMRATHMQEKHGELLKLIAGITMLVLAAVMFIDPTLMEQPVTALVLFAAAFALAGLTHVVTEQVKRTRALRAELELVDVDLAERDP
jgi:glutaredoxin